MKNLIETLAILTVSALVLVSAGATIATGSLSWLAIAWAALYCQLVAITASIVNDYRD